jgi:hypothetical protein
MTRSTAIRRLRLRKRLGVMEVTIEFMVTPNCSTFRAFFSLLHSSC